MTPMYFSFIMALLMALLVFSALKNFELIYTSPNAIYCQEIRPLAAYPNAKSMLLILLATVNYSVRRNVSSLPATNEIISESAKHREIMLPKNNTRNQNSDRCILHDLKKSSPIANLSVVLPLSFWASILFVLIMMASLCSFGCTVTATRYRKELKIVINAPTSVCVHCATHSKRVFTKADDCRQCLHLWDMLCKENSTTSFFEKMWGFLGVPNKLHNQANVVGLFVQQSAMLAFPATSFLPSLSALQQGGYKDCFDHVGSRLASLAALPPSCNHSRIRLAEAGFHYDARLNPNAVICHRCGAVYDISSSSTTSLAPPVSSSTASASSSASFSTMTISTLPPLAFHQQASPNCPVVNQSLIRNTPRSAENVAPQCVSATASLQQSKVEASNSSSSSTPSRTVIAAGAVALTSAQSRPVTATGNASGRDIFEDCDAAGPLLSQSAGAATNQNMQTDARNISGYTLALSSSSADQRRSVVQPQGGTTGTGSGNYMGEVDRTPLDLSGAVYPQFSTASMRLGTFRNWPLMTIFPPQNLVSLGFYYAGYADCIRCFYCGVGLKSWDPADDVLTEHVRWRPQCSFLLATKGSQVVEDITNKLNRRCGPETTK